MSKPWEDNYISETSAPWEDAYDANIRGSRPLPIGGSKALPLNSVAPQRQDTLAQKLLAPEEMLYSMLTGAASYPFAVGASTAVEAGKTLGLPIDTSGKEVREGISNYFTYQPQSTSATNALQGVANATSWLPNRTWAEKAGQFVGMNPEQTGNAFDIATMGLLKKTPQVNAKLVTGTSKNVAALEAAKDKLLQTGINKTMRPSYYGKKTMKTSKGFDESAKNVFKTMVEDKESNVFTREGKVIRGELPETLGELMEANDNRIRMGIEQRTAIDIQQGKKGVLVDSTPVITEMKKILENTEAMPEQKAAAQTVIDLMSQVEKRNPAQAHRLLTNFDLASKDAFTSKTTLRAKVFQEAAGQLRDTMAKAYESSGAEYSQLGRQIRDHLAVEGDIVARARVAERANEIGVGDKFARYGVGGQLVGSLAWQEPTLLATAAVTEGMRRYYKLLNDPEFRMKKTFAGVEKINEQLDRVRAVEGVKNKLKLGTQSMDRENWSEAERRPLALTYQEKLNVDPEIAPRAVSPSVLRPPTRKALEYQPTNPTQVGMADESGVQGINAGEPYIQDHLLRKGKNIYEGSENWGMALTVPIAEQLYEEAGRDINKARELAKVRGYKLEGD